ncbi:MAG: hypothetical protein LBD82_08220, partial [Deltaproteobacteria bacterium]|nr:hypothetical protein [Deltaproteobacteria bacterium]
PAGLKGARIAVASNTVIDYFVDMALQTAGFEASAAQKVEINRIPLRFEMLMSGGVEATGLPDPLALLAESGGGRTLTSNLELGLSITGMVFTEQAMRAKAGLIKKMYLAYNRGVEYLAAHSPEDVRDILTQQMGFSPEQVHASTRLPLYRKAAPPPEEDLRAVLDWLAARGLIRSGLEPDALVNKAFLPE